LQLAPHLVGGVHSHGGKHKFAFIRLNIKVFYFAQMLKNGFRQGTLIFAGNFRQHTNSKSKGFIFSDSMATAKSVKLFTADATPKPRENFWIAGSLT